MFHRSSGERAWSQRRAPAKEGGRFSVRDGDTSRRWVGWCLAALLANVGSLPGHAADVSPGGEPARVNSRELFTRIDYANDAKSFPVSPHALQRCREEGNRRCSTMFEEARDATRSLLANGRQVALEVTLQTLRSECMAGREAGEQSASCRGAIGALFFFSRDEEDRRILSFFRTLDAGVVRAVLEAPWAEWCQNRPNEERWASYIDDLGGFGAEERRQYKSFFNGSMRKDHFRMEMLLE